MARSWHTSVEVIALAPKRMSGCARYLPSQRDIGNALWTSIRKGVVMDAPVGSGAAIDASGAAVGEISNLERSHACGQIVSSVSGINVR